MSATAPAEVTLRRGAPPAAAGSSLLMLLVSLIWGANFLVVKSLLRVISPLPLVTLRTATAGPLLLLILLIRRGDWRIARRDWPALLGVTASGIVLNQLFFLLGLDRTSPAHSALLLATVPAFVLAFGLWAGEERYSPRKALGIALSIGGAGAISLGGGRAGGAASLAGDLLSLLCSVSFAWYMVASRPLLARYGALRLTAYTYGLGALFFLPFGGPALRRLDWASLGPSDWAGTAYLVLLTSVLAYLLFCYVLERLEASKVAIFTNLQPIVATVLSVALLGEPLTTGLLVGGAAVILGVSLTERG